MAMRMTTTTVAGDIGILKYNDYKATAVTVESSGVTADETTGRKIVKAGTPVPNESAPVGLLLHTVDVTNGDVAEAAIYEGSVDNKKLTALGVTVSEEVKAKFPRITFFD
jgi:hypothetical protein